MTDSDTKAAAFGHETGVEEDERGMYITFGSICLRWLAVFVCNTGRFSNWLTQTKNNIGLSSVIKVHRYRPSEIRAKNSTRIRKKPKLFPPR